MSNIILPDVAILAGGLGTRLRSVIGDLPKALAPILGRPFLAYVLEQVDSHRFRRIIICCGHGAERIQNVFGYKYGGLELHYAVEDTPLGTAGALRAACHLINTDAVVALNGDSFCDLDFERLIRFHNSKCAELTLTLTRSIETARFGTATTDNEGRICSFREKAPDNEPGWINAGIYVMQKAWLNRLPKRTFYSLENDVLGSIKGQKIYGYKSFESIDRFIDIGTPESYRDALNFFCGGDSGKISTKF
jgi:NDP-sugar pyrophosphorylase family protein